MKDIIKIFAITVIGLFVAIIGYPFLHESGHILAALCFGAKISAVQLLPIPFVECNVAGVGDNGRIFIGLFGMIFPVILSVISFKNFWLWLGSITLSGIGLLSFVLSVIALICYKCGSIWQHEDIIRVLKYNQDIGISLFIGMVICSVLTILLIIKRQPINRIKKEFNI